MVLFPSGVATACLFDEHDISFGEETLGGRFELHASTLQLHNELCQHDFRLHPPQCGCAHGMSNVSRRQRRPPPQSPNRSSEGTDCTHEKKAEPIVGFRFLVATGICRSIHQAWGLLERALFLVAKRRLAIH